MQILWTNLAENDLDSIESYISADNPVAAIDVILNIISSVENQLPIHPNTGRNGRIMGTRELVITEYPYIVIYRVVDNFVEILRILHTSRKWKK